MLSSLDLEKDAPTVASEPQLRGQEAEALCVVAGAKTGNEREREPATGVPNRSHFFPRPLYFGHAQQAY
jgi:hypothetical protein